MAKRSKRKAGGHKAKDIPGISEKSYKRLVKEARNARARLRDFSSREDADNYFAPDAGDYTLNALLNRIANGERVQNIFRELGSLTAEKIRSGTPLTVTTDAGFKLTRTDKNMVIRKLNQVNKNITEARKEFDFAADIMPQPFNANKFVSEITSRESLQFHLKLLDNYTPDNLIPTAVNDSGEAGTMAEYKYYRAILEKENQRREFNKQYYDPRRKKGFFIMQDEYDLSPIDIDAIQSIDEMRRRATTWDDFNRLSRANLFLTNYLEELGKTEAAFKVNNKKFFHYLPPDAQKGDKPIKISYDQAFKEMRDKINKYFFNEDSITKITRRMPALTIDSIYKLLTGTTEQFIQVYEAWKFFDPRDY